MRDPGATNGVSDHKTRARIDTEGRRYTIIANVGDQQSDLINELAEMTFKVPNPSAGMICILSLRRFSDGATTPLAFGSKETTPACPSGVAIPSTPNS
jgi:hypothetical protein